MKEDLKILNVEYLNNQWLDLTQICLGYQVEIYKCFKRSWHPKEEELKTLKVECLSNHSGWILPKFEK